MSEIKTRRRKGERKDGLIQVTLQIGYKEDGSPLRKSFYGHSRSEAERKKKAYIQRQEMLKNYDPDITVSAWIDEYLRVYRTRVNPAYIKSDNVPYNRMKEAIGTLRVYDIRESNLQKALNELSGKSFSAVAKYEMAMKKVFSKAYKNHLIQDDPSTDLERPPCVKGTHRALEAWEIDFILAHWNDPDVRCGLWILIMMLCGLRRGELMGLTWEAIDMEKKLLHVRQVGVIDSNQIHIEERAKSAAGLRTLPICNILFKALDTIPKEKRTGYVCLSSYGETLTQTSFHRGMEHFTISMTRIANGEPVLQYGKRNDMKKDGEEDPDPSDRIIIDFTAHDLRHTYATALFNAKVPAKAAQYFLGHSDIKITLDLYTHLSKEAEQESSLQTVEYLDSWIDKRMTANPFIGESESLSEAH